MKKIILFSIVLLAAFSLIFLLTNNTQTDSLSQLKENHINFIKEHPFSKTLQLSKSERKEIGLPPNKYFEQEYLLEMNPRTGRVETEKLYALQKELWNNPDQKNVPGTFNNSWEERGPNNIPGRTRAIMFDPNDTNNQRVFAGGVSGGLWSNDNIEAYSPWQRIGIPENLAVSSITYDPNNTQNMFLGTGESYVSGAVNGNGIWRSTDGGTTWEHVMGGSTGVTFFNGDATLTINTGSVAGEYSALKAVFGPQTTSVITANLAIVDDGSSDPTFGCNPLINGSEISGKIAIIERGACAFVDKVMNAQNAGAVAVIVVNSFAGTPIVMGGTSTTITIPSSMVSHSDGQLIMNAMQSETLNASFAFDTDNDPSGVLIPGAFHINDIKTRNNGGTTEIYASISDAMYASGGGSIFASSSFGLYKSTDNGDTWSKLTLPLTSAGNDYMLNDIEIGADNKIWVTTTKSVSFNNGGGTILSSTDGVNFEVEHTITGDADRTEIAVSSIDPNKLYVLAEHVTSKVVIYKTTDGFTTSPTSLPLPVDAGSSVPANDFTRGQAFYDLMIAVDPNNDDIVYVGGIDAFRSDDGGTTWSQISKWTPYNGQPAYIPYVHADHHELIFHPTNSDKAVLVTDGGVSFATSLSGAVSSNSAITSNDLSYNTTQYYKAGIGTYGGNDVLLAGAQDNGTNSVANASNGINNFSEIFGGDGCYCFVDKDNQYMIGSTPYNNFRRFSITGAYQTSLIAENNGGFVNVAELDDNLEILYTDASTTTDSRIARLLNVNATPSKAYLTDAIFLGDPTALKVSPYTTTSSTLFVGTQRGNVFRVDNANTSPQWTTITGPEFFGSVSAINFGENEDEIMVTYHNYGVKSIWFTDDGGVTWQDKEGDFPDIPIKDILMNPLLNNEVIIATDLGVWATNNFSDASPNWMQSQNGMQNVKVTSFDLRISDHKVVASTYGRGLFTGYFTTSPIGIHETNILSNDVEVYPTLVSNGEIKIKSTNSYRDTQLIIFDTEGKQVFNTIIDIDEIGKTVTFNLNSGVYILKFNTGGLITSKKIIVQ